MKGLRMLISSMTHARRVGGQVPSTLHYNNGEEEGVTKRNFSGRFRLVRFRTRAVSKYLIPEI